MAPKRKQAISFEKLCELGKQHLPLPNSAYWLNEDVDVVVDGHLAFFVAVGPETQRLNPLSLTSMVKEVFENHLNAREALLYGQSLAAAYSHCMLAGDKATTGAKLGSGVRQVYKAAVGSLVKQEVKQEPRSASSPPKKAMKLELKCLESPSKIQALYAGGSSSSGSMKAFFFVTNCMHMQADAGASCSYRRPQMPPCRNAPQEGPA